LLFGVHFHLIAEYALASILNFTELMLCRLLINMPPQRFLFVAHMALSRSLKSLPMKYSHLICFATIGSRTFSTNYTTYNLPYYVHSPQFSKPSPSSALHPYKMLHRRALSHSETINNPDLIPVSGSAPINEKVSSGIRLLQNKDFRAAIDVLEEFENSDNVLALSALGRCLLAAAESLNDADSDVDHSELALKLKQSIRKLARANTTGKSQGCRSSTIDPDSVRSLISRGLACLRRAVHLNNDAASLTALANHAVALFQRGDSKDLGDALSLYESAGVGGDADAWYNLGILHYNGIGVPVDRQLSLIFIRKAANLGDSAAHFFLYSQCEEGSAAANQHLDVAAAAGHPEAVYYKAMTLQGKGKNFIPALVNAAEKGSVSAAATLGSLHYNGESGAVQSPSLAAKWWAIAANAGHAGASHNLAVMYEYGVPEIGFKQDYSMCVALHELFESRQAAFLTALFCRAYAWYSAAALEGNADSLQCLADMTRLGQGVPASETQALELQKAADELRKAESD
jgi:TPR repeat protein